MHTQKSPDYLLWFSLLGLQVISVLTMIGIGKNLVFQHITYIIIGWGLFFVVRKFGFDWWWRNSRLFFIISFLLLFLTPFFASNVRGAKRWLDFGPVRLQTSEVFKPFFILLISQISLKKTFHIYTKYLLIGTLSIVVGIITMLQPDLGTTILYVLPTLLIVFTIGIPLKIGASILGLTAVLSPIIFEWGLKSYQKQRIFAFLDPDYDPLGSTYNVKQALIAIGSGGLFGKGLGLGTQAKFNFLPEDHTDFIFASLVEQFGLLFGMLIVILYAVILYRMIVFLQNKKDERRLIYGIGIITTLFVAAIINISMNMGIAPVTGITLPLVSYGGSSILAIMLSIGILYSE